MYMFISATELQQSDLNHENFLRDNKNGPVLALDSDNFWIVHSGSV